MKVRGHGGFWVLSKATEADPTAIEIVHNAAYHIDTVEELKQSRTANGGGWTEGLPVVRRVESATFRVAEDDVSFPQALGFTEGRELTVYLRRGELDRYDKLTRTIVESVHVENDQKKARWVEIVCKHGRYERDVPRPPALP